MIEGEVAEDPHLGEGSVITPKAGKTGGEQRLSKVGK